MSDTIGNRVQKFHSPAEMIDFNHYYRFPRGLSPLRFCLFSTCKCRKGNPGPGYIVQKENALEKIAVRFASSSCPYLNSKITSRKVYSDLHSRLPNPILSRLKAYIAPASLWELEFSITLRESRTALEHLEGHSKSPER